MSDTKVYTELARLAKINATYVEQLEEENITLIKQNAIYKEDVKFLQGLLLKIELITRDRQAESRFFKEAGEK